MCKMYLSLLMPACMSLFHVVSIYIERDVCVWKWTYTSQPHGYKEVRNHPSSLGLWGPTFQGVENSRVLCPAANRTWKMMFSTNLNIIWTAYSSLKKQLEHTCKSPLFWLPYKPSFPASFLSLSSKLVPKHRVTQHFAKLRLCAHVFLRGTLPKLRPGGSSAWLKTPCGYPNLPAESRFFWWAMKTKSPWNGSCNGKIIGKYRKITHLTEVLMGT